MCDITAAAKRAAEKLWATGNFGLYMQADVDESASLIEAEFAPRLAAKDAEIAELQSLVEEAESRANGRGVKLLTCCFCNAPCESLAALKEHSAGCKEHPLAAQVAQCHADAAETDAAIRESAKRVLPAEKVDGNSVCVPPVEEVVEMRVERVAELRRDAERYRWLRDDNACEVGQPWCVTRYIDPPTVSEEPTALTYESLDTAIDAAIASGAATDHSR